MWSSSSLDRRGLTSHYYWVSPNVWMADWGVCDDISPYHPSLSSTVHSLDSNTLLHNSVPLRRLFLTFPKSVLQFAPTFLLLLFFPLFWVKMVLCFLLLHCSHFVEIVCLDFCLLLVMNHVSFLCIPQWMAQCMAHLKHWMVWKSCLCLWSSCLFLLPHTQNPELVQTQNSELFSPLNTF